MQSTVGPRRKTSSNRHTKNFRDAEDEIDEHTYAIVERGIILSRHSPYQAAWSQAPHHIRREPL